MVNQLRKELHALTDKYNALVVSKGGVPLAIATEKRTVGVQADSSTSGVSVESSDGSSHTPEELSPVPSTANGGNKRLDFKISDDSESSRSGLDSPADGEEEQSAEAERFALELRLKAGLDTINELEERIQTQLDQIAELEKNNATLEEDAKVVISHYHIIHVPFVIRTHHLYLIAQQGNGGERETES